MFYIPQSLKFCQRQVTKGILERFVRQFPWVILWKDFSEIEGSGVDQRNN